MAAFLHGQIRFLDIYPVSLSTLEKTTRIERPVYDDYVAVNAEARRRAAEEVEKRQMAIRNVIG